MVVSQILSRKIIFLIVFVKIYYPFLKNLKLALGIQSVTRNSLTFFHVIQKQKTKINGSGYFASRGKIAPCYFAIWS